MNGWLSKKLQSQFKSSKDDIAKQALSKLQQLESRDNTHNSNMRTSRETGFVCRNCSTVSSGFNNTISVTLNQDLLAKTDLGNLTTVEELTQDPGFQEFLSSQLQLYFKFITNASTNNLLSKAKRKVLQDEAESSAVPACESGMNDGQGRGRGGRSQQALGGLDNVNDELVLSLIEEEDARRASDDSARNSFEVQNPQKERSPPRDNDLVQSPTKSRFPRQTQRSIERQQADVHAISGSSVMGAGHPPVRTRPSRQTQRSKEREQANSSVIPGSSLMGTEHSPVRSRLSQKTQRSKKREQVEASVLPGFSVMGAGHSPVKSRQAQQSQERQEVDAVIQGSSSDDVRQPSATRKLPPNKSVSNVTDLSTRKTSRSTKSSNNADFEQTVVSTTRKRGQKSAVNETEPQQSDDVFKVPPPPKPKIPRSRSNEKRGDNYDNKNKEGQRLEDSSQLPDKSVFKVPLPVKPRSAPARKMDAESTVSSHRSRTGRISKPPGSYWDPPSEKQKTEPRALEDDRKIGVKAAKNESQVLENDRIHQNAVAKTSKMAEKRPSDISLSGMDSESGYVSGIATGQKKTTSRKVSRIDAVKEPEKRQTLKDSRGRARKAQNVEPVEELEKNPRAQTMENEPPRRRGRQAKVMPTEMEPPSCRHEERQVEQPRRGRQYNEVEQPRRGRQYNEVEQPRRGRQYNEVEQPRRGRQYDEVEQPRRGRQYNEVEQPRGGRQYDEVEQPRRGRQYNEVEHSPSTKMMPGRKNIFSGSDSDETNDDTILISNKKSYYDPIRRREVNPAQKRIYSGRTSLVESSSDEEEVIKSRRPARPKKAAAPRRKEKIDVVSSEEDDLPVKSRITKSKPYMNADVDTSPLTNRTLRKRPAKARYLFSGSSTDDDSIYSSRRNTRNGRDQDSGSFVDDASYMSSARNSYEQEILTAGWPTVKNRNAEVSRRPQLVSRFRI